MHILHTVIQSFDTYPTNVTSAAGNASSVERILEVASTKLADGVSPIQVLIHVGHLLMDFHYSHFDWIADLHFCTLAGNFDRNDVDHGTGDSFCVHLVG